MTGLVVVLGLWTLFAQMAAAGSASFTWLTSWSWVPLLVAVAFLALRPRDPAVPLASDGEAPEERTSRGRLAWWVVGAALAALAYSRWRNRDLLWLLLVGGFFLQWRAGMWGKDAATDRPPDTTRPLEVGSVLALALLAAFITSVASIPHGDDSYFLSVMRAALSHPDAAIQSFDALHNENLPPIEQAQHLPQMYELGIAALTRLIPVQPGQLYYVVLPPLWAVLGTLVQWRILRHFLPREAALTATAALVALLVLWGDSSQSYGSFAFARLFQGKAVHIYFLTPLIVWNAFRFRERPGWQRWAVLALTQLAASGVTVNAVALGPVAAGLVLIAPPWNDALLSRGAGIAASIPTLLPVVLMYSRVATYMRA